MTQFSSPIIGDLICGVSIACASASEGDVFWSWKILQTRAEWEKEILDLKITNRAKDMFIEQLREERESFTSEREGYVEKLMAFNQRVGELQTKLLQLEAPRGQEKSGSSNEVRGNDPTSVSI